MILAFGSRGHQILNLHISLNLLLLVCYCGAKKDVDRLTKIRCVIYNTFISMHLIKCCYQGAQAQE